MKYRKWKDKNIGIQYSKYKKGFKKLHDFGLANSRMLGPRQFERLVEVVRETEHGTPSEVRLDLLRKQSKLRGGSIAKAKKLFRQYKETNSFEYTWERRTGQAVDATETVTVKIDKKYRKEARFFRDLSTHDLIAMDIRSGKPRKDVLEEYGYNLEDMN